MERGAETARWGCVLCALTGPAPSVLGSVVMHVDSPPTLSPAVISLGTEPYFSALRISPSCGAHLWDYFIDVYGNSHLDS